MNHNIFIFQWPVPFWCQFCTLLSLFCLTLPPMTHLCFFGVHCLSKQSKEKGHIKSVLYILQVIMHSPLMNTKDRNLLVLLPFIYPAYSTAESPYWDTISVQSENEACNDIQFISCWHFCSGVFVFGQLLSFLQCPWLATFLPDDFGSFTYKPRNTQLLLLTFSSYVFQGYGFSQFRFKVRKGPSDNLIWLDC